MTELAAALALVGAALVLALWDALRRALGAQVRLAELRAELVQRTERSELSARIERLEASVRTLRSDHESLDTGLALGRAKR